LGFTNVDSVKTNKESGTNVSAREQKGITSMN